MRDDQLAPYVPVSEGYARLAAAMLDTLAVRARLGESAADLKAFALSMVPGICSSP